MTRPTRLESWLASISRSLDLCCGRSIGNIPQRMLRAPDEEKGCPR